MLVVIRGAGDLATGIALRLHRAGYQIVMTDLPAPTSIRRTVCFSEAIRLGEMTVEDISARKAETPEEALTLAQSGVVAVLADPAGACIPTLRPGAVVDAILAKKNLGTALTDAPVVIGVGPGFTVGTDCHAAVETMRGHTLGRALYTGSPLPNTGIPGLIGGRSGERVLRAPADGIFEPRMEIGQLVQEGEIAATVNGKPMRCTLTGCPGLATGRLAGPRGHEMRRHRPTGPAGQLLYCLRQGHRHRRRRTGGTPPLRMPAGLTFTVDISPHFPV